MHIENFYAFVGVSIAFVLYAVYSSQRIISVKSYFHRSGGLKWFLSLSAANITLGTGVAYYLTSSSRFGWLMMISPFMVLVGYLSFAYLVSKKPIGNKSEAGNFLLWVEKRVNAENNTTERISLLPTISLALTFLLILAFEIYASSKIVSQMLFHDVNEQSVIFVAIMIAAMTIAYTLWGGIVAVLKTDWLQILGVVAVIVLMVSALFEQRAANPAQFTFPEFSASKDMFWPLLAAGVGALATQFYSLLNWGALSNFDSKGSAPLILAATGVFTSLLLGSLVLIGLVSGSSNVGVSFHELVGSYYINENALLAGVLVAGMVCIIFSTADSLMIQISMFVYDNILGNDSNNEIEDSKEVRKVRLYSLFSFIIVVGALFAFIHISEDLLFLLFAVAGGITIYAPMMTLALLLSDNDKALSVITGKVSTVYFLLFVIAFLSNGYALKNSPEDTAFVTSISFFVSLMFSIFLYRQGQGRIEQ